MASVTFDINSFVVPATSTYVHQVSTPSNYWTINHNLGFKPTVQVYNAGSQLVLAQVAHNSVNQVIIYFCTPTSGYARLI